MRHGWPIALVLTCGPAFAQDLDATQRLGQHLFNQSCRVCHAKPQFNSAQYGPALSKDSASGNAGAMREVIANGTPRMPGFRHHFKPDQIDAIVAYLKTVAPVATPSAPTPSRSGPGAD
jgi:mono/diheme cytochrome c family protein